MKPYEKAAFLSALKATFDAYRHPLPGEAVLGAFWRVLGPFPGQVVADALDAHLADSEKPPTPADVVKHCRAIQATPKANPEHLLERPPANPDVVKAQAARMRDAIAPLVRRPGASARWAFDLLLRNLSASGGALPSEVVRVAEDAAASGAGKAFIDGLTHAQRQHYKPVIDAIRTRGNE